MYDKNFANNGQSNFIRTLFCVNKNFSQVNPKKYVGCALGFRMSFMSIIFQISSVLFSMVVLLFCIAIKKCFYCRSFI